MIYFSFDVDVDCIGDIDYFDLLNKGNHGYNGTEKVIKKFDEYDDTFIILNIEETENIKIAFSSKYMMEAIKVLDCDKIELCFNGEIKPIIINYVDNDDLTQLILPIRTY